MPTDLTERLAAKLSDITEVPHTVASIVVGYLPLLLSEPELVASLPDAVRLSVLTPRERAELRLGRTHIAQEDFDKAYVDIAKLTPLGQPTPEYNEALRRKWDADREYFAALAEVAALTPEGKE